MELRPDEPNMARVMFETERNSFNAAVHIIIDALEQRVEELQEHVGTAEQQWQATGDLPEARAYYWFEGRLAEARDHLNNIRILTQPRDEKVST